MTSLEISPEKRERIRRSVVDPVQFVNQWLDGNVWETQGAVLESLARKGSKTAVKACHSSGKTYVAALAVLWFLARFQEAIVVTTAPTAKQVEKMLWGDIHSALSRSKYPYPEANLVELKFDPKKWPKRYATGFTTSVTKQDEGVKFQGFHADHILFILDEAPGIDPKIWDAIEGARAGGDVRILALGNPTVASGTFHDAFIEGRGTWKTFTISAFDTPNLDGVKLEYVDDEGQPQVLCGGDPKTAINIFELTDEQLDENPRPYLTTRRWILERWKEWGKGHPLWESRVLGQFPTQAENALISLAWLEAAEKRTVETEDEKYRAGLDVAGPGEAETVLVVRKGGQIVFQQSWTKPDPRGEVLAALEQFKGELESVNVDSIGIGWGMYLHLKDHGFPAKAINVGLPARSPKKFKNLKAELYWGLRLWLKEGDVGGLTDERTIGQLAGIRYEHNSRGQVEIESKDEAAKRGVPSPDRAEAIMLAFAERSSVLGLVEYLKKTDDDMKRAHEEKYQKPIPANFAEACETADTIAPLPDAPTGEDVQKIQTATLIKPTVGDNTLRCPKCGSIAIQRISGGRLMRCSDCGNQDFGDAAAPSKPAEGTTRTGVVHTGNLRK